METKQINRAPGSNSRRSFLKQVGIGSGAIAVAGAAGGISLGASRLRAQASAMSPGPVTDANILNFALNLEYLEAEFYTMAVSGHTIDTMGIGTDGTGTAGPTTGGARVEFNDREHYVIAEQIAKDERAHVKLLRAALGKAAVAKPAINLNALGIGFASYAQFLVLARIFEDTGVSAYGGAVPYIQNKMYLLAAARILSAENQHAANIRQQLLLSETDNGGVAPVDNVDIPVDDYRYFSLTYQGLSTIRSPRQVLDIVFHSKGATSGGFFPSGVNNMNLAGLAAVPAPDEYIS